MLIKKTLIRINDSFDLDFVTSENFLGIFLPFTEKINTIRQDR